MRETEKAAVCVCVCARACVCVCVCVCACVRNKLRERGGGEWEDCSCLWWLIPGSAEAVPTPSCTDYGNGKSTEASADGKDLYRSWFYMIVLPIMHDNTK